MSEFYVYEHWRPDTGVCFYVGKGKDNRAYSMNRKGWHSYIVAKLEGNGLRVEVRIVADGMSEQDAFDLERRRIAHHGRKDRGTGTLVNSTDGGDGRAGWKASPETCAKIAAALTGNTNFSGKICSPEHRAKISEAHAGKVLTEDHKRRISEAKTGCFGTFTGKSHSAESRAKMAAGSRGKKASTETRKKMSDSHKARSASKAAA